MCQFGYKCSNVSKCTNVSKFDPKHHLLTYLLTCHNLEMLSHLKTKIYPCFADVLMCLRVSMCTSITLDEIIFMCCSYFSCVQVFQCVTRSNVSMFHCVQVFQPNFTNITYLLTYLLTCHNLEMLSHLKM